MTTNHVDIDVARAERRQLLDWLELLSMHVRHGTNYHMHGCIAAGSDNLRDCNCGIALAESIQEQLSK